MTDDLPKITPLTLKRRAEPFDHQDWLFELKYDGFRALLEIDGAGGLCRLLAAHHRPGDARSAAGAEAL